MRTNLLRGVGLALIAMPEPITTPIGVGVLAAAWVLSRHEESKKRAYLRHILTEYLHSYRPFGYGMNYVPKTSADLPYREPKPLYSRDGSHAPTMSPVGQPAHVQAKPVFHVFDRGAVSKRFDPGGTRRGFEGFWGRQTRMDIGKVVHHNLRLVPSLS